MKTVLLGIVVGSAAVLIRKLRAAKKPMSPIVEDGFGNAVMRMCPRCFRWSMIVVRPGVFRCGRCE